MYVLLRFEVESKLEATEFLVMRYEGRPCLIFW